MDSKSSAHMKQLLALSSKCDDHFLLWKLSQATTTTTQQNQSSALSIAVRAPACQQNTHLLTINTKRRGVHAFPFGGDCRLNLAK